MRWPHQLDWRTGATFVAAALVLLLAWIVLDASRGRQEAFRALEATAEQGIDIREAQTERISELLAEVGALQRQVGVLSEDVRVLRRQIEEGGGNPRVDDPDEPRPRPDPRPEPEPEPQPRPQPDPQPEPEPEPEPDRTCVGPICIGAP